MPVLTSFPQEHQLDAKDCGATCLKIIAKYYGRFYTLQFLRDKCGVTREGVSLYDICSASESIGLKARPFKASVSQLNSLINLPCILHWGNNHFVVLYKIKKDKYFISDPARGKTIYSSNDIKKKWIKKGLKKGVLITVEPQLDFYDLNIEEKIKKRKIDVTRFLKYFKPYSRSVINLLLVIFIITLLQAFLPFITKSIIDIGIQTKDFDFISIMTAGSIVLFIAITLSNSIRSWITMHITARINISLISDYLIKLMKLPFPFFENKMIGDILQRVNDHERIRNFIMGNSLDMIFSSITFLVFTVILASYDIKIFIVFLSGSTLYLLWIIAFLKIRKTLDLNYFELQAKNQSYWVEMVNGMQDIKVNNYEKRKRWKWENIQSKLYKINIKSTNITNYQNLGGMLIDNIKNVLITFFCAWSVVNGEMTLGTMMSTQFIIGMLNGPIQQFVQFIISAQVAKISFVRLNEIQLLENEESSDKLNSLNVINDKSIILNNVSFQYAINAPFILQNVKLSIPQGKVTAIVGHSGSGKTTLLKLLLRLYKPTLGEIIISDINLNNLSVSEWRDRCGVVLQDGRIFNDTVLNNIVLDDENIDYDMLRLAVESANIIGDIQKFPLGYQTVIGEHGRGISGGQKQRILIARALYKNPDYIFLDEATNSLDTINERQIVSSFEKVFRNKTVVVIAHRLSTIINADQIIVLKDGRIIETGDHESLITKGGHYFNLIKTQANF